MPGKSQQNVVNRNNPPRVQITYTREENGASIECELSCVIGVLGDFTGVRSDDFLDYGDREFINIDKYNFNTVLKKCMPSAQLDASSGDIAVSALYTCESMDDFRPERIIAKLPSLKDVLDDRNQIQELVVRMSNNGKLLSAFIEYVSSKSLSVSFLNEAQTKSFQDLCDYAITKHSITADNPIQECQAELAKIDSQLSVVLDAILHNPSFQKIESSWRGLWHLVSNADESIKIKIFNATYNEVFKDLDSAASVDRSVLFDHLYEKEYGTLGGSPYSFLVLDYHIGKTDDDIKFLRHMSGTAACCHAPAIVGVDSSFFGIDSFTNFYLERSMKNYFESVDMAAFNGYRETEDSRYLALTLPRFMSRIPYGPSTSPVKGINYTEEVPKHENFLWSNASYIYGQKIAESFSNSGWFSGIVGIENGGKVDNLPVFLYEGPHGDKLIKCPTEVMITDRREYDLSNCGFLTLCYCKDSDYAVFFSTTSSQKAFKYKDEVAAASADISTTFPNMLNVSRFAQYCHMILRNKIGSMTTKEAIQYSLNSWIANYVSNDKNPNQAMMCKYPLKRANVLVFDENDHSVDVALGDPHGVGSYRSVIYMTPHDYLKEISVSLRLVKTAPKLIGA